ncbi:MAG: hypothetical protein IPG00_09940 [Saprospiraceae bacterium]|nr:hypothetical protein [Saprospiraceae bacterium]
MVNLLYNTNKALGVFQSGELSFGTKTFTATTEVKVTIVSVDSKVDEPDDFIGIAVHNQDQ